MPVKCPNCSQPLPDADLADGWCDHCGKRIPEFVLRAASGLNDRGPLAEAGVTYQPGQRELIERTNEKMDRTSQRMTGLLLICVGFVGATLVVMVGYATGTKPVCVTVGAMPFAALWMYGSRLLRGNR
jgi:hypothetical protein